MTYRLVTLAAAKDQLSIPQAETAEDSRVTELVEHASEIVMDYINAAESLAADSWTDSFGVPTTDSAGLAQNVPSVVKKATLLLIARLDDDREGREDSISPGVASLLARFRDPPVA